MLRLAACLEEHFPHSMANAVVEAARRRGLRHEERHAKVEYLVAHGIASSVDGEQVRIGSAHFIFEDEKVRIPEGEQEKFDTLPPEFSQLYLAIDGVLSAVICISEAKDVFSALRRLGVKKTVMLTGDSPRTAAAIAAQLGVDDFRAGVLPADKAEYVAALRREGHTVLMVGDGINDSPALSEADAGIAISDGAAIAREIADITIAADSLWELVQLRPHRPCSTTCPLWASASTACVLCPFPNQGKDFDRKARRTCAGLFRLSPLDKLWGWLYYNTVI